MKQPQWRSGDFDVALPTGTQIHRYQGLDFLYRKVYHTFSVALCNLWSHSSCIIRQHIRNAVLWIDVCSAPA
jgi:hypothetical protein